MTWKKSLLGSIEKWDKICFEGGIDDGRDNCPLCIKDDYEGLGECTTCPIYKITKLEGCAGTPHQVFCRAVRAGDPCYNGQYRVRNVTTMESAIQEYLFLCMLYHEYFSDEVSQ